MTNVFKYLLPAPEAVVWLERANCDNAKITNRRILHNENNETEITKKKIKFAMWKSIEFINKVKVLINLNI